MTAILYGRPAETFFQRNHVLPVGAPMYFNALESSGSTVCIPYKVTGYNNILHILTDTQKFKSKTSLIPLMLLLYTVHCQ